MKEREIIDKIMQGLSPLSDIEGFSIESYQVATNNEPVDLKIKIALWDKRFSLACEIKNELRSSMIGDIIQRLKKYTSSKTRLLPVVVVPFIGKRFRDKFKKENIFYFDLSGNIFLAGPGIYIEKETDKNLFRVDQSSKSPFADKASLVLRLLLSRPHQAFGIREIAREAGINPGWVSRIVRNLLDYGYLGKKENGTVRIIRPREVLQDWAAFYDYRKNSIYSFYYHSPDVDGILQRLKEVDVPDDIEWALTLQAGASLVAPFAVFGEVYLYTQGEKGFSQAMEFWKSCLQLETARIGANLFLMKPYYKNSVFWGKKRIKGYPVVSAIQLYLDLKRFPLRGEEQAEHIFKKRFEKQFKELEST